MPGEKFSEVGVVPEGTVAVTLGVDTQSDGFYWVLACWGRKLELWLPLTERITGDMRSETVWKALSEVLVTTWLDKDGNAYRPVAYGMDVQGDFYPEALEFVRARGRKSRLQAMRGYSPFRSIGAGRSFGILRNTYQDKPTGVVIQNVDVDIAKTALSNMLAMKDPVKVHLPCYPNGEDKGGWDVEAIAELTAEYRRASNQRGYIIERWYKRTGRANHRLDCLVYSMAALSVSRLKIDDCELQRVEARNVGKPEKDPHTRPRYGVAPFSSIADLVGSLEHQQHNHWGVHQRLF